MNPKGSTPATSGRRTVAWQPYLVSLAVFLVALAAAAFYWQHSADNALKSDATRLEHRYVRGAQRVKENAARITALHEAMVALLQEGPLPPGAWRHYARAIVARRIPGLESFGVVDGDGRPAYWREGCEPLREVPSAAGGIRDGKLILATAAAGGWRAVSVSAAEAMMSGLSEPGREGEPRIEWSLRCGVETDAGPGGRSFEVGIAGQMCQLIGQVRETKAPARQHRALVVGSAASLLLAGLVFVLARARWAAVEQTETIRQQKRKTEADARNLISIANRSDNGFFILDGKARTVWVNDVVVRRSGYSREELIGREPFFLLNGTGARLAQIEEARRNLEGGQPVRIEAPAFNREGESYWVELDLQPIRGSGGESEYVLGITKVLSDDREARDSALRMRHALESVDEGIAVWDRAGRYVYHNPAFERRFGYTMEACRAEGGPDQLLEESGEAPEQAGSLERTIRCADGSARQTRVTSSTIRNELNQPIGRVAIFTDISEAKEVERQLRESRDAALEVSAAKSAFLANMSHELRTPLNGVIGMVNLLLTTDLDEEQREYGRLAHLSGELLLRVINDILDISKLEAGRMQLECVPFDLEQLLAGCAAIEFPAAARKGISLEVQADPSLARMRRGDPTRLRQIVGNLLSNAVKFTQRGGIQVRVCSSGGGIRIEVSDTGVGIPPQALPTLFDSFTQADVTTTRRFGGTGLGLSICRQLVTMMGGTISVTSQPGFGTTFTVEAPIEAAAEAEVDTYQLVS